LNYHCTAYLALSGTSVERTKTWTQNLLKETNIKEIKSFCNDLKESFITMKKLDTISNSNSYITDCLLLRSASSIPLFLKIFRYSGKDEQAIQNVAKQLENILFRLIYTIADYRTDSLPSLALEYEGNLKELEGRLKETQESGFQWWWEFSKNSKAYFDKNAWHYDSRIKYVLWKYENFKREEKKLHPISPADFTNIYAKKNLENTIDHITPQHPNFTKYTEEFEDKYLNCIGNLALITWGNNSQKSNNDPATEIDKYDSDYISHQEIRDVLLNKKKWTETEIKSRKKSIIDFIIDNWDLT
jgi:hypothetical protein